MNSKEKFIALCKIDGWLSLRYSKTTKKFYVSSTIGICDGITIQGIAEYRETPAAAIDAFIDRIVGCKIKSQGKYYFVENSSVGVTCYII